MCAGVAFVCPCFKGLFSSLSCDQQLEPGQSGAILQAADAITSYCYSMCYVSVEQQKHGFQESSITVCASVVLSCALMPLCQGIGLCLPAAAGAWPKWSYPASSRCYSQLATAWVQQTHSPAALQQLRDMFVEHVT
jgi:hypothetical protein